VTPKPGVGDRLVDEIEDAGGRVRAWAGGVAIVEPGGASPGVLGALPSVASARLAAPAHETVDSLGGVGLVTAAGEGAASLGAAAWQRAGLDGGGMRLAIIDTGYANWAAAAAAGRVTPSPALDLNFCDAGFERTDHGTATAEIVWDMAPQVDLVRVCIDDTADLAEAVTRLIADGVDVVNMSLGFYNTAAGDGRGGPGTPDDSVRRALAAGVVWVNSAGNEARSHVAAPFADGDADGQAEWSGSDEALTFVLPPSGKVDVYIKWNDWLAPSNDFFLCLTDDPALEPQCFASQVASAGTPTISLGLTNPFGRSVELHASLLRRAGTAPVRVDGFFVGAAAVEHPDPAFSLAEPAAVEGVIAVGAACIEGGAARPTSSQGPTLDGRPGITVVAPGAVSSFIYGDAVGCDGGYEGSSASAPHVAGALALIAQGAGSGPGAAQVALVGLAAAAGDPGQPGVDTVYGAGRLTLGAPPVTPPTTTTTGPPTTTVPPTTAPPTTGAPDRGGFGLATSPGPGRGGAVPLRGATLSGIAYVHLTPVWPSTALAEVRFSSGGRLLQVEKLAGYDLGGGQSGFGYGFDSWRLGDGIHELRADILSADGRRFVVTEPFRVDNGGRPRPGPRLEVSVVDEAGERPLDGAVIRGPGRLVLVGNPGAAVSHVLFYVNADPVGWDGVAPYDTGAEVDLARYGPGQHAVQLIAVLVDGRFLTANAAYTVR
jgi:hypothetical protein